MRNWLQGLVRCSCGHSLVRKNKNSKSQPNYSRYYCTARVRGVSKCPSVSTPELEGAVLTAVGLMAGNQFASAQADELKARVDALEAQVALSND
ncbi:zinc ribbon domain-containing protein [Ralstonia pseudosolanacearum]|uniref:zinc ribbon domain-containing protein n=1 Tax=Ralstonia pseudosolanacearum TaxID=1310165 RepID=UPI00399D73A3